MPRDEEDDAIPEELPPRRASTQPYRAITPTDAKTIAEAAAAGQLAAQRDGQLRSLEMHFAEWFGADGDGGRLAGMERKLEDHDKSISEHGGQIAQLAEFKARILWLGGLAVTVGGAIAAIGFKLVEHLLK